MSITSDILHSWRAPRVVFRRHLARGTSEAFAFAILFTFLLLAFVAQWPRAARIAFENDATPLSPQLLALALGILATIPFWYGLAALSRVVIGFFGGKVTWYGARLALFWSLAAVTPLVLLYGVLVGLIGLTWGVKLIGFAAMSGFCVFWFVALREVHHRFNRENHAG